MGFTRINTIETCGTSSPASAPTMEQVNNETTFTACSTYGIKEMQSNERNECGGRMGGKKCSCGVGNLESCGICDCAIKLLPETRKYLKHNLENSGDRFKMLRNSLVKKLCAESSTSVNPAPVHKEKQRHDTQHVTYGSIGQEPPVLRQSRQEPPVLRQSRQEPPVLRQTRQEPPVSRQSRQEPPVLRHTRQEPPVLRHTRQEPPVLQHTRQEPPVLQHTRQEPPVLQHTRQEPPVLRHTRQEPPVLQHTRQEPPVLQHTRQEPPVLQHTRQEPPVLQHTRQEPPVLQHTRQEPPVLQHTRQEPPVLRYTRQEPLVSRHYSEHSEFGTRVLFSKSQSGTFLPREQDVHKVSSKLSRKASDCNTGYYASCDLLQSSTPCANSDISRVESCPLNNHRRESPVYNEPRSVDGRLNQVTSHSRSLSRCSSFKSPGTEWSSRRNRPLLSLHLGSTPGSFNPDVHRIIAESSQAPTSTDSRRCCCLRTCMSTLCSFLTTTSHCGTGSAVTRSELPPPSPLCTSVRSAAWCGNEEFYQQDLLPSARNRNHILALHQPRSVHGSVTNTDIPLVTLPSFDSKQKGCYYGSISSSSSSESDH